MLRSTQIADISIKGLFVNADSGVDTSGFRSYCFRNEIFDNIDKNGSIVILMEIKMNIENKFH